MTLVGKQRTRHSFHVAKKRKISVLGVAIASIVVTLITTMVYLTVHPPSLMYSPAAGNGRGDSDSNRDVNALMKAPNPRIPQIPKLLPLQNVPKGFATDIDELLTSPALPKWVKDYVHWHAAERQKLLSDPSLWKSVRFLMLQCLPGSRKCGGTADRLKPLPVMLRIAHQNKRLLLIKWGRPADLEEYLLPPQGGLDWRVPKSLYQIQDFRQGPRATYMEELIDFSNNPDHIMVKARVQAHDHGSVWYNEQRQQQALAQQPEMAMEPTFEAVYHLVWPILFSPAPPVAKLIERQLDESPGLVPGRYVGIHVRALYAVSERDPGMVQHWTRNALNCASQILPGGPFYLSSDSSLAVTVGRTYGTEHQVVVGSRTGTTTNVDNEHLHAQPFHLDKAPRSAKVSDFYDTFVDLYILAMSRCMTYNMGGFGTWALLMSPFANTIDSKNNNQHSVCSFQHHEASGIHKCEWAPADNKPSSAGHQQQQQQQLLQKPLFLPPIV